MGSDLVTFVSSGAGRRARGGRVAGMRGDGGGGGSCEEGRVLQ